jgi:hypothetical protein
VGVGEKPVGNAVEYVRRAALASCSSGRAMNARPSSERAAALPRALVPVDPPWGLAAEAVPALMGIETPRPCPNVTSRMKHLASRVMSMRGESLTLIYPGQLNG